MLNKIIITLIILSGLFSFQQIDNGKFYPAQFAFFIFSVLLFGSILIYNENKWLGVLSAWCSFSVFITYLLQRALHIYIFKDALVGIGMIGTYYSIRQFKIKGDYLKLFLIPAFSNIVFIFIQKFDHILLPFFNAQGVYGFLGNPSVTAVYIALTTPLFFKYYQKVIPILFISLLLVGNTTSIIIFITSLLACAWLTGYVSRKLLTILCLVFIILGGYLYKDRIIQDVQHRSAIYLGTLDGIKHNPILGWGVGSFEPIMTQVPVEESKYGWGQFNYKGALLNHPHNEFLYGWWGCGIIFPIILICLLIYIIKHYTIDNAINLSILIGGFICIMFYFLNPPHWFFLMMTLGIYDNQREEARYA